MTATFGVVVANGYTAFKAAAPTGSPCAAGLLIPVPGACDIHPSQLGHQVLAQALLQAIGI